MAWNEETRRLLAKLKLRGMTNRMAAREMGIILQEVVSPISVEAQVLRMRQSGWFLNYPEFAGLAERDIRGGQQRLEQIESPTALRKATIEHLLDLKRAGHSPTRTEYVIGSDGLPRRLDTGMPARSYCGSPSALLAGEA